MAAKLDSLLGINEDQDGSAKALVPVLLPVALEQTYDYVAPEGTVPEPGAFYVVPFGAQHRIGVVWDTRAGAGERPPDPKKLKALLEPLDVPPLPVESMRFAEWISSTRWRRSAWCCA